MSARAPARCLPVTYSTSATTQCCSSAPLFPPTASATSRPAPSVFLRPSSGHAFSRGVICDLRLRLWPRRASRAKAETATSQTPNRLAQVRHEDVGFSFFRCFPAQKRFPFNERAAESNVVQTYPLVNDRRFQAASRSMFLRAHHRSKDGKEHTYWSLVEMVRTPEGPRQRALCYLGELNDSAQARWWKTIEVFNEQGESRPLKLFPSHVEVPEGDPNVARVLIHQVRLERARQFGNCWLGLELWKRLGLDHFCEEVLDAEPAEVRWSRVAAVLAVNRLCAPGSELAIEERWYPSTALDDLLGMAEGQINDTRLYRCLDRLLPQKSKLEQHLRQRYGELFQAEFDVLLYDLTSTYVEGTAAKNPLMQRGYSRDHRPDCKQVVIA